MKWLALLVEKGGAYIECCRRGIGSDPRIGFQFLYAGCGYGGSCFPKDVKALVQTGHEQGQTLQVLTAVEAANDRQKHLLFERRSEEHTSELQSLMRISYAGFCLKKKNTTK